MKQTNRWLNGTLAFSTRSALCMLGAVAACSDSRIPPPTPGLAISAPGASANSRSPGKAATAGRGASRTTKAMDAAVARQSDEDDGGVSQSGLRADGEDCSSDVQCASGHCSNALCCSGGNCCLELRDCRATDGIIYACDYANTCQGSRGEAKCSDYRCVVVDGSPDDTGCYQEVEADDCGPYKSVYCSGASEQQAPHCAETCAADSDCDADARCTSGVCVRKPGAIPCEQDSECAAGEQCTAGVCAAPAAPASSAGAGGSRAAAPASAMSAGAGNSRAAASVSCNAASSTRDACSECACSECAATAMACMNSGDATRDSLCKAVLDCALPASCIDSADCQMSGQAASMPGGRGMASQAYTLGCFGRYCYCVTDSCIDATGPCRRQMQAAAGNTTSSNVVSMRLRDPAYAVSYAEQHAECLQRSCRTQCGL